MSEQPKRPGEAAWQFLDRVTATRKRLLCAGYKPIPTIGKAAFQNGWQKLEPSNAEIDNWARQYPDALNTGILTRTTPAVDIDVLDTEMARELHDLLMLMIGDNGHALVRYGKRPKRAVLFQTDKPFDKIATPVFVSPDGIAHRVEVLCDGQQIVAHGIHPDTGEPYAWDGDEPDTVPRDDLPYLNTDQAADFVAKATDLMRSRGWTAADEKRKGNGTRRTVAVIADFDAIYGAREQKFAASALADIAASLASTTKGSRNDTLYRNAFRLGTMTARGWLQRDTVAKELLAASVRNGYIAEHDDALSTITRGLDDGGKCPHENLANHGGEAWRGGATAVAALAEEMQGWRAKLLVTPTRQPKALLANALIALREAPEWQSVLAYDEFALTTIMLKPPPWLRHEDNSWTPQRWSDRDDALTADWLQHHGIGVTVNVAATAAETVAKDATFHPIRDYLTGLCWDGNKRVARLAATYLGAEATPYHAAISRCVLIAAVARIMRPGCKADYMPILEGAQDKGKSTAIELLFAPWFSDDLAELGTKDAAMQVRVAWGIEVAELASMTRAEIERIKSFITRKVDRFRPSYGRRVIEVPRQSIFLGSTNADTYLKDETGGRRFWPITCGTIDLKAIQRDREQIWAEAMALYKAGEPWWLTDTQSIGLAREAQRDRYVEDAWQAPITKHIEARSDITIAEILTDVLFLEKGRWGQAEQNRVAQCLTALDWERYRTSKRPRVWRYRPRPEEK